MISRSIVTLMAVAAVSLPAILVPALFAPAAAQINLDINFGPPPQPQYEAVPAPRPGYLWAPGHWRAEGRQHFWVPGHWEQQRAGYRYVPNRWERYDDNGSEKWRYEASRWDRDGDGVPDRQQRIENRNSPLGDKDRDGIPNILDNQDNRPRR